MTTTERQGHRWVGEPDCEGEGSWSCTCNAICDHETPCSRHGDCPETVALRLTRYERDNLLDALARIAGYRPMPPSLNSGDWVMQVASKLGFAGERTDYGTPNLR